MANTINTTGGVTPIGTGQQQIDVGQVDRTVGAGAAGAAQGTVAPDALQQQGADQYKALFAAIFAATSTQPNRPRDVELTLAEVSTKLKDTRDETQSESVKANQEKIRTNAQVKAEKLAEQKQKLEEAEESGKWARILGDIGLGLGAVGVVVGAVGALATIAIGVVTLNPVRVLAGGMMMGMTAASALMLADGLLARFTGDTAIGHAMKALGASDEAVMGVNIAVQGLFVLGMVAAAGVTALVTIASNGTSFLPVGGHLANIVSTPLTIATTAALTASVIGAGTQVVSGGTQAVQAGFALDSGLKRADAMDKQGEAEQLGASNQSLESLLDEALALLLQAGDVTNKMLDAAAGSLRDRGDAMMQVRFGG